MIVLQPTFDADQPGKLCDSWADALGYVVEPETPEYLAHLRSLGWDPAERPMWEAAALDPHGVRPRLYFQRADEPKSTKNRLHLDVYVSNDTTIADEVVRLGSLGATVLYEHPHGNDHDAGS